MFLRPAPFADEPCALLRAAAQSLARVCCPALSLATTLAGRPSLLRVPRWRDETVGHVWRPCLKTLCGWWVVGLPWCLLPSAESMQDRNMESSSVSKHSQIRRSARCSTKALNDSGPRVPETCVMKKKVKTGVLRTRTQRNTTQRTHGHNVH